MTRPTLGGTEGTGGYYWVEDNVSGFSITGRVPFTLDWSSSSSEPLYMNYAWCSSPQSSFSKLFHGNLTDSGCSEYYGEQGTPSNSGTGNLSTSVPAGGSVVIAWFPQTGTLHNVTITYTFWTGLTLAVPILFGAGVACGVVGVVLYRRDLYTEIPGSKAPESSPVPPTKQP